jgi:chromosome segregation ATPase
MNIKEELSCKYCHEIFINPMTLPCGDSICKHHIEELTSSNSSNKFICPLCNEESSVQSLRVNKFMQSMLEIGLHEFKINPLLDTLLKNLKNEAKNLETVLKDPENFIYEQMSELKRQVDLDRENLKSQIDALAEDFIHQLNAYEATFKSEYKANVDLEHFNGLLESSRNQLAEYEQFLSLFSTKNQEQLEKRVEIEKMINQLQLNVKQLTRNLFSNLCFSYEPIENMSVKIKSWFGKLKIRASLF